MSELDPRDLVQLAERIAREAGQSLRAARDTRDNLVEHAQQKSSATDLATLADVAAERIISDALLQSRPDDGLLGEEGGSRSTKSGLTWVVDPLDGTTNFVYGYPGWCVSIGVEDERGGLAGVVFNPERNECFSAARGHGAICNGSPITRPSAPPLSHALVGTGFSYSSDRRRLQAKLLPMVLPCVRDIRRGGSAAIDLCSLSTGRLDIYYEAGLQPWDRAAGALIATECGLLITEHEEIVPGAITLLGAPVELHDEMYELLVRASAS